MTRSYVFRSRSRRQRRDSLSKSRRQRRDSRSRRPSRRCVSRSRSRRYVSRSRSRRLRRTRSRSHRETARSYVFRSRSRRQRRDSRSKSRRQRRDSRSRKPSRRCASRSRSRRYVSRSKSRRLRRTRSRSHRETAERTLQEPQRSFSYQEVIDQRAEARWNKDFKRADELLEMLRSWRVHVDDVNNTWEEPDGSIGCFDGPGSSRAHSRADYWTGENDDWTDELDGDYTTATGAGESSDVTWCWHGADCRRIDCKFIHPMAACTADELDQALVRNREAVALARDILRDCNKSQGNSATRDEEPTRCSSRWQMVRPAKPAKPV